MIVLFSLPAMYNILFYVSFIGFMMKSLRKLDWFIIHMYICEMCINQSVRNKLHHVTLIHIPKYECMYVEHKAFLYAKVKCCGIYSYCRYFLCASRAHIKCIISFSISHHLNSAFMMYYTYVYCQLHNNCDTFEKELPSAYKICILKKKKYIRAIIYRKKEENCNKFYVHA